MLGQISQAIEPLGQTFAVAGVLGSFLSLVLAIFLEWGNIKARAKGWAPSWDQLAQQSTYQTKPALRVPVGGYPTSKTPELGIARLVGKLFLDLSRTVSAILIAIAISANYPLLANYGPGTRFPFEWLLVASLALALSWGPTSKPASGPSSR